MSGKKFAFLGSTSLTRRSASGFRPSIRLGKHGRPMRDPEGHGDAEFDAFTQAGEVEVGKPAGDGIETNQPEPEKPTKPAKADKPAKAGAEKPAKAAAEKAAGTAKTGETDEGGEGAENADENGEDDEDEDDEDKPKPKPKASERIKELTQRVRQRDRLIDNLSSRLDAIEKGGLPAGNSGGKSADIGDAPDPNDTEKYPLGHLDDRYIEDKLEWLAETKAAGKADAVLQRQQESEQREQAEKAHTALLEKVDDLSTRGSELFDDFQETVVESGMRGDWRLDQPTFEAAHEAENGVQILYELSKDKKEAVRVAGLTPYQQMKFVMDRDAEIGKGKQPRKIPGAGAPPATQTRGANSRTRIDPATSNLSDFEKAWIADEKGG